MAVLEGNAKQNIIKRDKSHFKSDPPKQVKLADKPGSVVDSHSSRRFVT
jgi:hypothetical protein